MAVHFHEEDLPAGVLADGPVAVDTETMGLVTIRDRLCVVQISDGKGDEHLVRFAPDSDYDAPNLKAVLADPARLKLFHFARFDLAAIEYYLGVEATPCYCTKIASKLVRTYTDRHGVFVDIVEPGLRAQARGTFLEQQPRDEIVHPDDALRARALDRFAGSQRKGPALVVGAAVERVIDAQPVLDHRDLVPVEQEADLAARAERGDHHQRGEHADAHRQDAGQHGDQPVVRAAGLGPEAAFAAALLRLLGFDPALPQCHVSRLPA